MRPNESSDIKYLKYFPNALLQIYAWIFNVYIFNVYKNVHQKTGTWRKYHLILEVLFCQKVFILTTFSLGTICYLIYFYEYYNQLLNVIEGHTAFGQF